MTERLKGLAEAAGFALTIAGVAMLSIPVALIIAGVGLVAVGNLPGRR